MTSPISHPRDISCLHPAITQELYTQTDRDLRTYGYDGEDYYDNEINSDLGYYNFTHHPGFETLVTGIVGPGLTFGGRITDFHGWDQIQGQRWVSHNVAYDLSLIHI